MTQLTFQVDTRLAYLLSENYRSTEKALKELIDNAWDADAENVTITLPEPLTISPEIVIEDDGTGMVAEELRQEYLFIASDRRQRRGERTALNNRKVKGRKGIGKFAGLMTATTMKLETWARGNCCSFVITKEELDKCKDIEGVPIDLSVEQVTGLKTGTRITLSNLNQDLAFPDPSRLRQLLVHEYGRERDFHIQVNGKSLDIDDIQGTFTEITRDIPKVGKVNLRFTISSQNKKLRQSGIAIRVDGKIIGRPSFFGLDKAEDFPPKLLNKLYGEIEADGLSDHVTADWGALIENSELLRKVEETLQPILREKFQEEYGREINLAQARLKKKINDRLASLPEYKREYADKAIKKILHRYYGEPESKLEPIVNVVLDALERSDYREVIEHLYEASNADIATIAEVLNEFGLVELAVMADQTNSRLTFLDSLEQICDENKTLEESVHKAIENNLWTIGHEYTLFSSNKTLKKQIEEYLDKEYKGEIGELRPDLLLNENILQEYLLIEFKRPNHTLRYQDYQQATRYRNDFGRYTDKKIRVILIGGKRGNDLPPKEQWEPQVEIIIYSEMISTARNRMNWLLKELSTKNS
ncbi:MAG: ATP-binding protein [Candidatus Electrothrix sp. AUS1_2]|nr:ATP-binding protein [Candidatus Electrothrix sp. AUS1_2]